MKLTETVHRRVSQDILASLDEDTRLAISTLEQNLIQEMIFRFRSINGRLGFGSPSTATGGVLDNLEGSWVSVQLTNADSSPSIKTCSHYLNETVVTGDAGGTTVYYPNVTWLLARVTHGDLTTANAPPAAGTAVGVLWPFFNIRSSCTADTIDLTFEWTGTIAANQPVLIDLFFMRAFSESQEA